MKLVELLRHLSNILFRSFHSCLLCSVSQRSGWSPAPAGFAPSADWQTEQAADFADIRQVGAYN